MPVGFTISINKAQLREATAALAHVRGGIEKALAGAITETAKSVKSSVSRAIREQIVIKKKDVDKHIFLVRAAPKRLAGGIRLEESGRISLKYFGARQTKAGVTYRVSRTEGRKLLPGAFGPNIARLGGHVFKRAGQARLPLRGPLKGPSPWGVFVKKGLAKEQEQKAIDRLEREIDDRVTYLLKKAAGVL